MRTQFIFISILILSTLVSGKIMAQTAISNTQEITTRPFQQNNSSGELRELFKAFLIKQSRIERIKYNATRIDTLLNADIRNNTGNVILERDKEDSVLKICFRSKMDSMDFENIYFRNINYEVHTNKFYQKAPNFRNHIFGSPGGQLVITDLLNIDTTKAGYTLFESGFNNFIYKSDQELGSSIITKTITIDKQTLVPTKVSYIEKSKQQSWLRSTTFFINDVYLNDQIENTAHVNVDFLSKYGYFESDDVLSYKLVGKKIPDITLQTFDNRTIKIRDLESKVVLLDFWELWCKPCIQSLPKMKCIAKAYQPFGLVTVGIASDDIEKAKQYIATKEIDFTQAIGNDKLKSTLKVNSFPRYILINRKGIIEGIYYGYSDKIELDINSLLLK
jgi:thiol-disulfide isomerase/thioredoxin